MQKNSKRINLKDPYPLPPETQNYRVAAVGRYKSATAKVIKLAISRAVIKFYLQDLVEKREIKMQELVKKPSLLMVKNIITLTYL